MSAPAANVDVPGRVWTCEVRSDRRRHLRQWLCSVLNDREVETDVRSQDAVHGITNTMVDILDLLDGLDPKSACGRGSRHARSSSRLVIALRRIKMSTTGLTPKRTKVVEAVLKGISETLLEAHVASAREEADGAVEDIAREDLVEWLVEFVENMASKDSILNADKLSKVTSQDVGRASAASRAGVKKHSDRRSISSLSTATGIGSMLGESLVPNQFGR
mmetsp:Transcript_32127/g.86041  ORF Transcript_32127/g.86041 Transcript_32127/m.86041 type:complete len:219 (-) Transcript_32127:292-948(-)